MGKYFKDETDIVNKKYFKPTLDSKKITTAQRWRALREMAYDKLPPFIRDTIFPKGSKRLKSTESEVGPAQYRFLRERAEQSAKSPDETVQQLIKRNDDIVSQYTRQDYHDLWAKIEKRMPITKRRNDLNQIINRLDPNNDAQKISVLTAERDDLNLQLNSLKLDKVEQALYQDRDFQPFLNAKMQSYNLNAMIDEIITSSYPQVGAGKGKKTDIFKQTPDFRKRLQDYLKTHVRGQVGPDGSIIPKGAKTGSALKDFKSWFSELLDLRSHIANDPNVKPLLDQRFKVIDMTYKEQKEVTVSYFQLLQQLAKDEFPNTRYKPISEAQRTQIIDHTQKFISAANKSEWKNFGYGAVAFSVLAGVFVWIYNFNIKPSVEAAKSARDNMPRNVSHSEISQYAPSGASSSSTPVTPPSPPTPKR